MTIPEEKDKRSTACRDLLQLLGQEPKEFDDQGVIAFTNQSGEMIRLETAQDILFLELNPAEQAKITKDEVVRFMQRSNLREHPPFLVYISWLEEEATPRLIIRFNGEEVSGLMLMEGIDFLKRFISSA